MTKAEERKVLSEICKLIDSTGQDGYVKMAFAGVPYYAERNIEEDGAFNPVEERDMWENKAHELERQSKEVGGKLLKIEHERDALESNLTALRGEYEVKHQKWCEANKRIAEMQEQIDVCGGAEREGYCES